MSQAVQTVIPPRPQAEGYTDFRQVIKSNKISDVLAHPEMLSRLQQSVPRHLSPQRMLRVFTQAIQKTPDLAKCTAASLVGAMMVCASLGLEPNTPLGHAYLIPFKGKRKIKGDNGRDQWVEVYDVNLIIGYKGLIDLARRSGSLTSIHADVVYPGDEWSFEFGSNQHLRHKPTGDRTKEPIWAYCHAKLSDGEAFSVLPWSEVIKIRNNSQGYRAVADGQNATEDWKKKKYLSSPWVAHLHEMGAKTALRNLSKYLPMSIEFASAAALDEMSEGGRADLSHAAMLTGIEDVIDSVAIEDQSGEQEPATFVEQGMQQQGGQQQQQAETVQQTQGEPQQQPKQRQPRKPKDEAKSPPPPPAAAPSPPPPPAAQQQKTDDVDLTCMPFTAEVVNLDGETKEFEKEFIASMRAFAQAGQLNGFIESHQQAIDDMKSDTPNLFARTKAEFDRLSPPAAGGQAQQQDQRQSRETIRDEEPDPDPRGEEPPPDEDDGDGQPSFV